MTTAWPYGKLEFGTKEDFLSTELKDTTSADPQTGEGVTVPGMAKEPSDWPQPHAFVQTADDPGTCRCGIKDDDESEDHLAAHSVDLTAVFDDTEMTKLFAAMDAGEFTVADELLTKAEEKYLELKAAANCAFCDKRATVRISAEDSETTTNACAKHTALAKRVITNKGKTPTVDKIGADAGTKVAGVDTHPGDAEKLREYWVHGAGAAKIKWGAKGDFNRCVKLLTKYLKDPEKAKGYCNLRHHEATAMWPSQHAAAVSAGSGKKDDEQPTEVTATGPADEPVIEPAKVTWGAWVSGIKLGAAVGGKPAPKPAPKKPPAKPTTAGATTADEQSGAAGGDFNSKHPRIAGRFAPKGSGSTSSQQTDAAGGSFDDLAASILAQAHAKNSAKAGKTAAAAASKAAAAAAKAQRTKNANDAKVARYLAGVAKAAKAKAAAADKAHKAALKKQQTAKAAAAKKAAAAAKKAVPLDGPQMTAVQKRLAALFPSQGVTVEGIANGSTSHAVKLFQSQNGLPPTGVIDKATYAKLSDPKAKAVDPGKGGTAAAATTGAVSKKKPSPAMLASLAAVQARAAAAANGGSAPASSGPSSKTFTESLHPRDKGKFVNKHGVDTSKIKPGDVIHTEAFQRTSASNSTEPAGKFTVAPTHSAANNHAFGHVIAIGKRTKKPKNFPTNMVFLAGGGISVPLDAITKHKPSRKDFTQTLHPRNSDGKFRPRAGFDPKIKAAKATLQTRSGRLAIREEFGKVDTTDGAVKRGDKVKVGDDEFHVHAVFHHGAILENTKNAEVHPVAFVKSGKDKKHLVIVGVGTSKLQGTKAPAEKSDETTGGTS